MVLEYILGGIAGATFGVMSPYLPNAVTIFSSFSDEDRAKISIGCGVVGALAGIFIAHYVVNSNIEQNQPLESNTSQIIFEQKKFKKISDNYKINFSTKLSYDI